MARAGRSGTAYSFASPDEVSISFSIEISDACKFLVWQTIFYNGSTQVPYLLDLHLFLGRGFHLAQSEHEKDKAINDGTSVIACSVTAVFYVQLPVYVLPRLALVMHRSSFLTTSGKPCCQYLK